MKEASYAVTTRAQARRQKPESSSADVLSRVSSPGGLEPTTDNMCVNMHDETPCASGAQSWKASPETVLESGVTQERGVETTGPSSGGTVRRLGPGWDGWATRQICPDLGS